MDIPVNAAKPGRRRYLTLVMIFITVVICYVDRANLAVASAHIQEEFGITKAQMGYVFSAFAALYLMPDPRRLVLDRVGSRVTYFIAIFGWSVATLFRGFATGLMSLIGLRAITGIFEAPAFPTNNRMVTAGSRNMNALLLWVLYVWSVCRSGVSDSAADLDSGNVELALGVHCHRRYRHYLVVDLV